VRDLLRSRALLLVFDNFEHVIGAAPFVVELLATCPGLRTLATSRIPLRVRWERELSIDPLQLLEA
jgi:predicted ATPase